jgi:hypothetical protein
MSRLPLERELAAVRTLGAGLGLGDFDPVVLKLANHTSLRLGPLVARVRSSGDVDEDRATMVREVAVATHLARLSAPTIKPSVDPPAGPHEVDRCLISLWAFIDHRAADEGDWAAAGAALKRFHTALTGYDGELPTYLQTVEGCAAVAEDAAAMAAAEPEDQRLLARLVREGLQHLPTDPWAWIALHGDTHLGNVMITPAGAVWADLEAVCRGPIEWDLCNKPASFPAAFEGVDPALLDQLGALRRACVAVWCWADAARSAEIRGAAEFHTAQLRREAAASRFA